MLKTIFYFIRRFPEQVSLFIFNSGIFAWLWKSGIEIANQISLTDVWQNHIPVPLQAFFGESSQAVQGFFKTSAFIWLVGSMMILVAIRFVKGLIKLLLFFFAHFTRYLPSGAESGDFK